MSYLLVRPSEVLLPSHFTTRGPALHSPAGRIIFLCTAGLHGHPVLLRNPFPSKASAALLCLYSCLMNRQHTQCCQLYGMATHLHTRNMRSRSSCPPVPRTRPCPPLAPTRNSLLPLQALPLGLHQDPAKVHQRLFSRQPYGLGADMELNLIYTSKVVKGSLCCATVSLISTAHAHCIGLGTLANP